MEGRYGPSRLCRLMDLLQDQALSQHSFGDLHDASGRYDHRQCAIKWISTIVDTHMMSSFSRDSAMQILDDYLASKNGRKHMDGSFVSHVAVVALSLSFRLHESQRTLHLSSFQDFDLTVLKDFEILMLNELGFALNPQLTPIGFVHELLHIWQPSQRTSRSVNTQQQKADLVRTADQLIGEFWEGKICTNENEYE